MIYFAACTMVIVYFHAILQIELRLRYPEILKPKFFEVLKNK